MVSDNKRADLPLGPFMTELQMFSHRVNHIVSPLIRGFLLNGVLLLIALPPVSQAAFISAITPDGTLGTTVAKTGNVYDINGGTIKGSNQFHSFGLFSVGTGDIASFNGPSSIANILSRVTGGQQSMIDGTLRSTIQGANLYLLNPAGVLFGANASLDLTGSFHVTTADYLRFTDGARFYADLAQPTVLSVAPVAAFGFLGPNPAAITIQGSFLEVPLDQTLSVVGGDMQMVGGRLRAQSGLVQIAGVASAGEVMPSQAGQTLTLVMQNFAQQGQVNLSGTATVTTTSAVGGGTVLIRGGRLIFDAATLAATTLGAANGAAVGHDIQATEILEITNGTGIVAQVGGAGNGTAVQIEAPIFTMKNRAFINTGAFGSGNGGNITVRAGTFEILDRAGFNVFTRGTGVASTIDVTADQMLISSGTSQGCCTGILASSGSFGQGTGPGAPLRVVVINLRIIGTANAGAEISNTVFGQGPGGTVEITASETVSITGSNPDLFTGIFANTFSSGQGPKLNVRAGTLQMSDYAKMQAGNFATGQAGGATIHVAENMDINEGSVIYTNGGNLDLTAGAVTISGRKNSSDPFGRDSTGINTGSGNIQITSGNFRMTQGGSIRANSFGSENGGDILLHADTVDVLVGSNILSVAFGSGNAGKIEVIARDVSVAGVYAQPIIDPFGRMVFNPSAIASQSGIQGGNAGNIKITATGNLQLLDGGRLSTNTFGAGNAGPIDITAENVLIAGANGLLRDALISQGSSPVGANAGISTATASSVIGDNATGRGGDIRISTGSLDLRQEGRIEAATTGPGDAGKIEIFADRVVLASDAFISSKSSVSSHAGKAGIISIVARDSFESSDAEVTTSAERAQGGDISLTAPRIELSNGAVVSAQSAGAGNAGTVRIVASDSFITRNSTVTTEAIQADGGNIELQVGHLIHLIDSTLSAKVGGGSSTVGGNITVDPDFFIVERSRIIANAFQGQGGNIDMAAGVFLVDPSSVIDASSALGINGTVNIQAPVTNLSGTLAPLPQGFLQAATLLAQRCAARMGGTYSTFVVAGREGLPLEPGGLLPSPLYEAGPAGALAAAPAQEAPGAADPVLERVLVAFHEPLLRPGRIWKAEGSPVALNLGCGS